MPKRPDSMSVEIVTFGCRLNAAESEVIRREAERAGLTDTVVVNTCAVTAEAVRQARQTIRAVRRARPQAKIVVTGCAAQTEPQTFVAMPEADRILGNSEKLNGAMWRETRAAFDVASSPKTVVNDIMAVRHTAAHLVEGFSGRCRAFVQVQNGCDHRCTFCIIPFGRGNSRSVPMGAVVADIERLVANGYSEIVLTGVDLTSYGGDLPGVEIDRHHVIARLGERDDQREADVPKADHSDGYLLTRVWHVFPASGWLADGPGEHDTGRESAWRRGALSGTARSSVGATATTPL